MNTRYLAILVTLALLGFSVPAAAHPCERDPGHKHCITETPQTTFNVTMQLDSVSSASDTSDPAVYGFSCTGTATGNNLGPGFHDVFEPCKILLDDSIYGPDFCLLGASVRITKKKTRVMIFMYNTCASRENVFRTLELPATVNDTGAGSFEVILDSAGPYVLTKNHQPDKERPLEEGIFVINGEIVYTVPDEA